MAYWSPFPYGAQQQQMRAPQQFVQAPQPQFFAPQQFAQPQWFPQQGYSIVPPVQQQMPTMVFSQPQSIPMHGTAVSVGSQASNASRGLYASNVSASGRSVASGVSYRSGNSVTIVQPQGVIRTAYGDIPAFPKATTLGHGRATSYKRWKQANMIMARIGLA